VGGGGEGEIGVAARGGQRGVGEPEVAEAEALDLLDPAAELAGGIHSLQDHAGFRSGHCCPSLNSRIVSASTPRPSATGAVSIHSPGVCSPSPLVTPRATAGIPAA